MSCLCFLEDAVCVLLLKTDLMVLASEDKGGITTVPRESQVLEQGIED